ncbi:alpha/beta hydrolase [Microbacterium sp. LWH10-1.2]|uniref:alpha/beta fold hydrolase n=1 Tax=Microbacterium sp. LWH10-1.2 TaxID=3135255 RepID=UPI00313A1569
MIGAPWIREFEMPVAHGSLRVREWGDPHGPLVVFHHGTPSSSIAVPGGWSGPASAGVRLCSYDRQGYGGSPTLPGRTVADAADWSARIADACGADRFAVMGTSGGGPHAVAAAALLPDRVTALCVDVGIGPSGFGFDASTGMVPETLAEIDAARRGETALRAYVESLGDGADALSDWVERLPPSDREVLGRADVQHEESVEADEWAAQGVEGWIEDDLALFAREWSFDAAAITAPTLLVYGGADVLVPSAHGEAWLALIPHAELRIVAGGGHWLRDHEVGALRWCAAQGAATPVF